MASCLIISTLLRGDCPGFRVNLNRRISSDVATADVIDFNIWTRPDFLAGFDDAEGCFPVELSGFPALGTGVDFDAATGSACDSP